MMQSMAKRSVQPGDGAVGTVETQYLDLPKPLPLDRGKELLTVPGASFANSTRTS